MAHTSKTTTDHDTIREWVEERHGKPACVKGTGGGDDPGMIRIDMPGYSGEESLQPISWDEWFQAFDDNGLAFVYQDETAGGTRSNFNKLVSRSTARSRSKGAKRSTRSRASSHGTAQRSTTRAGARSGSRSKSRSSGSRASGARSSSSRASSSRGSSHARSGSTSSRSSSSSHRGRSR